MSLPDTHTAMVLSRELRAAGLTEMADRAATGYYHDYLSPLVAPCIQLSQDLAAAGTPAALAIRAKHHEGAYDASLEESNAWASSDDGAAAFASLLKSN